VPGIFFGCRAEEACAASEKYAWHSLLQYPVKIFRKPDFLNGLKKAAGGGGGWLPFLAVVGCLWRVGGSLQDSTNVVRAGKLPPYRASEGPTFLVSTCPEMQNNGVSQKIYKGDWCPRSETTPCNLFYSI
tara:strand:- start:136198 stop:136587 length:390 start_codon:yes stop_codon:yes gene_type:complete